MRPFHVTLLGLLLLAAVACGQEPHRAVAPPDAIFAEADWEQALPPEAYTEHRQGTVFEAVTERGELRRPFPGVKVELLVPRPDGREPLTPIAETTTDAEGRFRIGPGPAGTWALRVSSPGFAPMVGGAGLAVTGTAALPESGDVQLWLRKARPLAGRVEDAAGAPVADVLVEAAGIAYVGATRTGPDGAFELDAPIGQASVWVADAERESAMTLTQVEEEGGPPLVLRAAALQEIRGRVIGAFDGRPIAGVTVLHEEHPERRAVSDDDGAFALRAPRDGRMAAVAVGWGWRTQRVPHAGDMEFRMYRAPTLTGRVLDAAGAPVEGARILAVVQRHDRRFDGIPGPLTDAQGRFAMSWVPPPPRGRREQPKFLARHAELGLSTAVPIDPLQDAATAELVLAGTCTIAGRVARASGDPEPGNYVEVVPAYGGLEDKEAYALRLLRVHSTVTDAEGRYRIGPVARAGGPRVELRRPGLTDVEELAADPAAHALHTVDFVLPVGRTISGTVVDRKGQPVTKGVVDVELLGGGEFEVKRSVPIDVRGGFVADDLPGGRYQLSVRAPGFDRGGGSAEAGESGVRLTAVRLAHLLIEVEFPEDATPAERSTPIQITVRPSGSSGTADRTASVTPEAPGSVPLLESGSYDVMASGGVWRGERSAVDLDEGERTVRIELRRTLYVPARLRDAAGEPVAGEFVNWRPLRIAGARAQRAQTGPDGRLDLTGLMPGTWEVSVSPSGAAPLRARLDVAASRTETLELRLPAHGRLVVRVRDADGNAVERAVVSLAHDGEALYAFPTEGPKRLASRFATSGEGDVGLVGVRAGTVRVTTRVGGKVLAKDVEVTSGGRHVVAFP